MVFNRVVLPEFAGPMIANTLLAGTLKLISQSTCLAP